VRGELQWEMLSGPVALVIYGHASHWTAPVPRAMDRQELLTLTRRLACQLRAPVELAFDDGSQIVEPTSAA
jgi:hypothetical protein